MLARVSFESILGKGSPFFLSLGGSRLLACVIERGSSCISYSEDAGRTWSDPTEIQVRGVGVNFQNDCGPTGDLGLKMCGSMLRVGSLCRLSNGTIGALAACILPGDCHVEFCISKDEGRTFTGGTRLGSGVTVPGYSDVSTLAFNGLLQLRSGRLVVALDRSMADYEHEEYKGEGKGHGFRGAYGSYQGRRALVEGHDHTPEFYWTTVVYSDDLGRTWKQSPNTLWAWLDHPETHESYHSPLGEAVMAEVGDNHLLMFMRSVLGRIYQAESFDGGQSWSVPRASELTSSGSPSMLRKIPSTGELLVVWNQVTGEEIQRGRKRSRICCAISSDGGRTWGRFKTLDAATGLQPVGKLSPSSLRNYRALDDVGEIPVPFMTFDYPDIAFVEDLVLIGYGVSELRPVAEWPDDAGILGGRIYYGKVKAFRRHDLEV